MIKKNEEKEDTSQKQNRQGRKGERLVPTPVRMMSRGEGE